MNTVEEQLERLIIKYTPMLHAIIKKQITTDYHDGWDAYQEICAQLWEDIPRNFDPRKGKLFFYFRRSVFNAVINYNKRRRRVDPLPPVYREQFTDRLMGVVPEPATKLVMVLVSSANTPLRRKVLKLCLYGYTPVEITRILHISRSTVYNHLSYFRKIIQEYRNVYF